MAEHAKSKDGIMLVLDFILLAIGLVLIFFSQIGMELIIVILAIAMLVYGVLSIFVNVAKKKKNAVALTLTLPVVLLVSGVLLLIFRVGAASTIFPIIIGAWAIIAGVLSLIHAVQVKNTGSKSWGLLIVTALIALVLGVLIIIGILTGANLAGKLLGIYFAIFGAVSIIDWFATYSAKKKISQ